MSGGSALAGGVRGAVLSGKRDKWEGDEFGIELWILAYEKRGSRLRSAKRKAEKERALRRF